MCQRPQIRGHLRGCILVLTAVYLADRMVGPAHLDFLQFSGTAERNSTIPKIIDRINFEIGQNWS